MARARRLPPLNGLRAFEATGRHLSFTKAAEELNVTQTAVSHQIKGLEEQLGLKLFHRSPGRVELTREGRLLLPGLTEAFDRMTQAVEDVRPASGNRPLIVSVTPAFGSKWLAGRLGRFWCQHPEVELVIQHTMNLVDLTRDEVDVAVRFGDGDWPGLVSEKLVAKDMVPICSPALLEGAHPLREPADLKHHTLLHEDDQEDWVEWLRIAGVTDIDPRRGPVVDDLSTLARLAMDGAGVAIAPLNMMEEELKSGRLVQPFDVSLPQEAGYHLVYLPGMEKDPRVAAFREFLFAEAAEAG